MIQQEVKLTLKQVQLDGSLRSVPEGRLTMGEAAWAWGLSRLEIPGPNYEPIKGTPSDDKGS